MRRAFRGLPVLLGLALAVPPARAADGEGGEKVYQRRPNGDLLPTCPGAPRLALHATALGFTHPVSGAALHWTMPLPADLSTFLDRLRGPAASR